MKSTNASGAVSHPHTYDDSMLALNGGPRTRREAWPSYDKGFVDISEQDEEAAIRALRSRRLFRYDDRPHRETEVAQLEDEIRAFFDVPYALACTSGTTALALALQGAGIGPGDQVAVPAFTFAATPSAIILAGAAPVVIEIDENLHIDIEDLKSKTTPSLKAVLAVHMRGFGCDIEQLKAFCDENGILLFEDAVPAMGVGLNGKKLGTFGIAGAFSTQSDKCINTGEGGFLVTSDRKTYERAVVLCGAYEKQLARHTAPSAPDILDTSLPIFSYRLDEIRGAIARSQLVRLESRVQRFQDNYEQAVSALSDLDAIAVRQPVSDRALLGESLIFRLDGASPDDVSWFASAMSAEGVDARAFGDDTRPNVRCFWNWNFAFPGLSVEQIKALYPNSTRYLSEAVDIPLNIKVTAREIDDLRAATTKVCGVYRARRTSPADAPAAGDSGVGRDLAREVAPTAS